MSFWYSFPQIHSWDDRQIAMGSPGQVTANQSFNRGDHVVWRSRSPDHIGYVMPTTVVYDDGDVIGLFQHSGSVCKRRTGKRGGPRGRSMLPDGWDGGHEDKVWEGRSNLHLHKRGTHHTVIRSWNEDHNTYEGWYINIEEDWRRIPIGFDTRDLILDVTVEDDLSSRALKDEDELAWAESVGVISPTLAESARKEADLIREAIENRAWPFFNDWSEWKPEPDWRIPSVPNDWQAI